MSNHLERLREQRGRISESKTKDFEIPGYRGMLWGTFVISDDAWSQLKQINEIAGRSKSGLKELYAQCNVIAMMCETLYFIDVDGDGGRMPLDPDDSEKLIGFGEELAEILGFQATRESGTRDIVRKTFDNDIAISIFFMQLSKWMAATDNETSEEFLGE